MTDLDEDVFADVHLPEPRLTCRQVQILGLVADGLGNDSIAARLFMSPHTVRTHLTAIFKRLKVAFEGARGGGGDAGR